MESQAKVIQKLSLDPLLRTPGKISTIPFRPNTLDSLVVDSSLPLL